MNKKIQKSLLISFIALFSSALMFGSGQKAPNTMDADSPVKLRFLTSVNVDTEGYDINDNPYLNYIEEKNNVEIEIISDSTNYDQKVNTMMASGDLPDYLMMYRRDDLSRWASEGFLLPLDSYIDSSTYLKEDMLPLARELSSVDGITYAIPMQRYDASPFLTFVRKDWVENLGIDTARVKTIDDWYNMLKAFTYDDPDGNGKDDTYGLIAISAGASLQPLLDSFDAATAKYRNGEVLPNYIQPEYKEWLKFMRKLYKEGILDPEYVVNTGTQRWEKIKSGKYGAFLHFWSLQEYRSLGGKRSDLIALPPAQKKDGSQAGYLYGSPVRHYIALTTANKNPQATVDMLDWAFSEEGGTFVHAGVEGIDYDMVDGMPVVKEDRRGKNWAWRFITMGIQKTKMDDQLQYLLKQSWGELGLEHLSMSNDYGMYDTIKMLAPSFPELADYDLDAQRDEFQDKAIIGLIDIDEEWDSHVSNWRKSGGDEFIRLHTQWYENVYMKRK